jgi:hypothetical protein
LAKLIDETTHIWVCINKNMPLLRLTGTGGKNITRLHFSVFGRCEFSLEFRGTLEEVKTLEANTKTSTKTNLFGEELL